MIELIDVHKKFGKQVVLDGVNFNVQEGETVALLGPSGTGKSVLLKHIIGLIRPDSGTIIVDDKDVGRLKRHELAELRSQGRPLDLTTWRDRVVDLGTPHLQRRTG